MFGEDANWGRILCAIGYADAEFDIGNVNVSIGSERAKLRYAETVQGTILRGRG